MSGFRLLDAALSDVGRVRSANEDSVVARGDLELWAVADGMGGHVDGRLASSTLAAALETLRPCEDFDAACEAAGAAIHAANAAVHARASASGVTMGSTAVALLIREERFAIFWAGDSRAYLRRGGRLYRLTRDHTQVQELVDKGYLPADQAKSHPMAHVLSRAVGVEAVLQLDAISDAAERDDVFLLCSDGLYGVVADAEMEALLDTDTPAVAAHALMDLCLERGAPDNVSIVVVRCQEPTRLRPPEEMTGFLP